MALGDRLSKAYELLPFDQSKYLRGRKLLGIQKEGQ